MHTHKTDTSIWRNTRRLETLVLLTTTSRQLSSTPENNSSFTSRNTDGRCSTPAVHKPLKKSRPSSQKSFQHHISIRQWNDDINSALSKHRLTGKTRLPTYSQNCKTYTAHSYVIAKLITVSLKTRQYLSKLTMTNSQ